MEPRNAASPVSIDAFPNEGMRSPPSGVALEKHYSIVIRRIFNKEPRRATASPWRIQIQKRVYHAESAGKRRSASSPSTSGPRLKRHPRQSLTCQLPILFSSNRMPLSNLGGWNT
jgi:hypothetical protein